MDHPVLRIAGRRTGHFRAPCPYCSPNRKAANRSERCLSVDVETDRVVYVCHHCGEKGAVRTEERPHVSTQPRSKPKHISISPLTGSGQEYLEERGISQSTAATFMVGSATRYFRRMDGEGPAVAFPYFSKDGLIEAVKYRAIDQKDFSADGAARSPFGSQLWTQGRDILLTEGEMDTLAIAEAMGIDAINIGSVPHGAPVAVSESLDNPRLAFLEAVAPYFETAGKVYVGVDMDGPGLALAEEIVRRIGRAKCWRVHWREKDANDVLVKHGRDAVSGDIAGATPWPMNGLYDVDHYEKEIASYVAGGFLPGHSTGYPILDEYFTVQTGQLTVVTGIPGCLARGTRVTMSDGSMKPVEDVVPGDNVVSFDGFMASTDTVVDRWSTGVKPTFLMTMQSGLRIQATADHRFLSWDGWKRLSELSVGSFMAVPRRYIVQGLSSISREEAVLAAIWLAEGNKNTTGFVVTCGGDEIRQELGAICDLMGWRMSVDGYQIILGADATPFLDAEHRRTYTAKVRYYLRRRGVCEESLEQEVQRMVDRRLSTGATTTPARWLKDMGLSGMRTDSIRVPQFIFNASQDVISAFLGALFSCDGSASGRTFEYTSNSIGFCRDVALLLQRFDIRASVRPRTVKYLDGHRNTCRLVIQDSASRKRFVEAIRVMDKQACFEAVSRSGGNGIRGFDQVPPSAVAMLKMGRKFHLSACGLHIPAKGKGCRVSREMMALAAATENNAVLLERCGSDVRWERIVSIEAAGEVETFDLETARYHNFLAEGIITHNSGKSEWVDQIMVNLAEENKWRFAVCSWENPPAVHIMKLAAKRARTNIFRSRTGVVSPKLSRAVAWVKDHFLFLEDHSEEPATLDSILDRLRAAILRYGIKGAVIDPYNYIVKDKGTEERVWIEDMLAKVRRFAITNGLHIFFVAHPTKIQPNGDGSIRVPKGNDVSGCYDAETEVLTRRGWIKHADVVQWDDVMCFDPATSVLSWNKPELVHSYDYKGVMHHWSGNSMDMLVTPNHRMVARLYGEASMRFVESQDINRRRWFMPSSGFFLNEEAGSTVHLDLGYDECDLAWFLGFWIAEGCEQSNSLSVCQAEDQMEAPREVMRRMGLQFHENITNGRFNEKRMWTARLYRRWHVDLIDFVLRECGHGCERKRIPDLVWSMSASSKKAFLDGFWYGDGSVHDHTFRGHTSSPELADQMMRLCLECGYWTSMSFVKGAEEHHRGKYVVSWRDQKERSFSVDRNLDEIPYDGKVYCLTVPGGAYVTRRNGKMSICGNSAAWFAKTDNGITVHRDQSEPHVAQVHVWKIRYQWIGKIGMTLLVYNSDTSRFEDASGDPLLEDGTVDLMESTDDPLAMPF